ncbi:MAG: hypothetical protein EOO38_09130 [Cytophagaceae bacterium]|nr:MAG: hypothetical protein EOO38_09130 [Cytophagaceae bacterium]
MQLSNNYTAVRLLLSAMVLYSHSFALIGLDEPLLLGRTTGNLAVHGFFSVSGYLVAGSYLNSSSLSAFVYKRILRLGPALIVAYAASMWMHGQFGTFATNPVPYIANGSIWTLPWEGLMYVGVAAAGALGILRANVAASLFANGLFIYFLSSGNPTPANQAIAPLVLLFVGGAFIRLNADKLAVRRQGEVCFFVLVLLFAPIISDLFFSTLSNIPFLWGRILPFQALDQFCIWLRYLL